MTNQLLTTDTPKGFSGVRLLTLNRRAKDNALDVELLTQLIAAFEEADLDSSVQAVVLTGAGDVFCGGGERHLDADGSLLPPSDFEQRVFDDVLRTLESLRTPVVVAANGDARDAGVGLVLRADLAVMDASASLSCVDATQGVFSKVVAELLYAQLPQKLANEVVLLGEPLSAQSANALGVVNRVVAFDDVLDVALGLAGRLANAASSASSLGRFSPYRAALDAMRLRR